MAEATKEAGLTMNGTEEEMWKLMESGKLLAKDVIPAFAKELRKTATDGNALAHALENNLSVAVGRATFNIQKLSNSIFTGGLAASLKLVIDSFNEISPKIEDIAYLFGKVLGGAIMGVTFPVVMLVTGLTDLWTITKMMTGVNDEMGASFLSLGAKIFGVFLGIKSVIWGYKKLKSLTGVVRDVGRSATGGATGSNPPSGTPDTTSSSGRLGRLGKLLKRSAGILSVITAANAAYDRLSNTNERNKNLADMMSGNKSPWEGGSLHSLWKEATDPSKNKTTGNSGRNSLTSQLPQKTTVDINVKNTVDSEGNMKAFVDSRIESADSDNQERAMNSIGSLY